jgi:biotin carboxyl carrier protein
MTKKEKPEYLNINNTLYQTRLSSKFRNRVNYMPADPDKILSFIPGTVLDIFVSEGQSVSQGELLLILDAMKMKNRLKSPFDGVIKSIAVKKGDRVAKGDLLIVMEPGELT